MMEDAEAEMDNASSCFRFRDVDDGIEAGDVEEVMVVLERVRRVVESASITAAVSRAMRDVRMLLGRPSDKQSVRTKELTWLCGGGGIRSWDLIL